MTKIVRTDMKKRARKIFSLFFWTAATFFWFMFGRRFAQMEQIYDFVNFLKRKRIKANMEPALLSESSLRKDWISAEEDEAWQDL